MIFYTNNGDAVSPLARQPRVHHSRYPHTPRRYGAKAVGDAQYSVQLVKLGEDLGIDNDNFENFMEVEETDGMSLEGQSVRRRESRSIHKSLKEGFTFKNSPILEDLRI